MNKKQEMRRDAMVVKWGEEPNYETEQHSTLFLEFAGRQAGINYCTRVSISPSGEVGAIPPYRGDSRFQE